MTKKQRELVFSILNDALRKEGYGTSIELEDASLELAHDLDLIEGIRGTVGNCCSPCAAQIAEITDEP